MAILQMSKATTVSTGAHFATKCGADKIGGAFVDH
jgi:hypothetical protein